jgi:hypothetical protein
MESLNFILKTYKNYGAMVEQKTRLDCSIFQFLKTQVKDKKPHVEVNMGKFESQISLF